MFASIITGLIIAYRLTNATMTTAAPRFANKFAFPNPEGPVKDVYCMAVNPYYEDPSGGWMVAIVCGSRILLVTIKADASFEPITIFQDETPGEEYHACCWRSWTDPHRTLNKNSAENTPSTQQNTQETLNINSTASTQDNNKHMVLVVAGQTGNIRLLTIHPEFRRQTLMGHGGGINELRAHPHDDALFLSASDDRSIRLWDVREGRLVAIFGGDPLHGHLHHILTVDWHPRGDRFMSAGIDGRILLWQLPTNILINGTDNNLKSSHDDPLLISTPIWSTDPLLKIHSRYVDCLRWMDDDHVMSKSVDGELVIWSPILETALTSGIRKHRLHQTIAYKNGSMWFTRFHLRPIGDNTNVWRVIWGNDVGLLHVSSLSHSRDSDVSSWHVTEPIIGKCPRTITSKLPIRTIEVLCADSPSISSSKSSSNPNTNPNNNPGNNNAIILSSGQDGIIRIWKL